MVVKRRSRNTRRTKKRLNRSSRRTIQRIRKKKYSKRKKKKIKKIKGIRYFQMGGDISNLEFGDKLGSGADGDVYYGEYKDRRVAIKVFKGKKEYEEVLKRYNLIRDIKFKRGPAKDEEFLCDFIKEDGKIIAGKDSITGNYVALFEIIEGKNLFDDLYDDTISGTQCKKYVVDILQQLIPLHAANLSHGDLGIQNIMLEPIPEGEGTEYFARVIDFDYAGKYREYTDMGTLGHEIIEMLDKTPDSEDKKFMLLLAANLSNKENIRLNAWNTYILLTGHNPKSILPENFGGCTQNLDFLELNPELLEKYKIALESASSTPLISQ